MILTGNNMYLNSFCFLILTLREISHNAARNGRKDFKAFSIGLDYSFLTFNFLSRTKKVVVYFLDH